MSLAGPRGEDGRRAARARDEAEPPPDTVHVLLPQGVDLHEATRAFRRFGEVSRLEMVPGDQLVLAVVFFDTRAAGLALGALDPELCWPAGHQGRRRVWLPGRRRADLAEIGGVASVGDARAGAQGEDDSFFVEFYDVRDAARFSKGSRDGAATAEVAAGPTRDSTKRPVPAYVVPTEEVAKAAKAAEDGLERGLQPRQTSQAVLVEGLPNMVASERCFPVVLQQAGLCGLCSAFEVWGGTPCGGALVVFHGQCRGAVERCVRHFHGRQWDPSGQQVTARPLAPEQAAEELAARGRAGATAALRAVAAGAPPTHPPGLPAKIDVRALVEERTAEESTDAGASEVGDDHGWMNDETLE